MATADVGWTAGAFLAESLGGVIRVQAAMSTMPTAALVACVGAWLPFGEPLSRVRDLRRRRLFRRLTGRNPPAGGVGRLGQSHGTMYAWCQATQRRPSGAVDVVRGCSSMAEPQPSKLAMRVRFPSPAPSAKAVETPVPRAWLADVRHVEAARRGCAAPGVCTAVAMEAGELVGFAQAFTDGEAASYLSQSPFLSRTVALALGGD